MKLLQRGGLGDSSVVLTRRVSPPRSSPGTPRLIRCDLSGLLHGGEIPTIKVSEKCESPVGKYHLEKFKFTIHLLMARRFCYNVARGIPSSHPHGTRGRQYAERAVHGGLVSFFTNLTIKTANAKKIQENRHLSTPLLNDRLQRRHQNFGKC